MIYLLGIQIYMHLTYRYILLEIVDFVFNHKASSIQ